MRTTKRYAEVQHGKRTVMGTEWPIYSFIERAHSGRRFVATHRLCNGVPSHTTTHATLREAKEAIGT